MISVRQLYERAVQYHQAGNLRQAEQLYRQILQVDPDQADTLHLVGVIDYQLGKNDLALEHITKALQRKPDFAEALSNLGNVLKAQGKLEEAAKQFHQALRLKPDLADAHNNLGGLLHEQGKSDEAVASLRQAVRLNPAHVDAHNNLGAVLVEQGMLDEAVAILQRALRLDPAYANAHVNLGKALLTQGKTAEAVHIYRQALRLKPDFVLAHYNLAQALKAQGQVDEARHSFLEALRLKPDFGKAHVGLGTLHREQGELAEAEAAYRQALRVQPELCLAHASLATLLGRALPEADLAALRQRLADARLTSEERVQLGFALANVLDDRADFDRAADCLRQANAARWELDSRHYRADVPGTEPSYFDDLLRECGPEFFARTAGGGLDTQCPVFVFGLPRSGTTLVEQILASHSRVYGAGEILLARQSLDALPAVLGRSEEPVRCIPLLEAGAIRRLAQRHLSDLMTLVPRREPAVPVERIVDKMPGNYAFLGLIAAMFPRAVLIHCRRDLRDVAVSCWMTNFQEIRWASDPAHLASHFRQYRRLMDHWRAVLPVPIHDVQYEELVEDLEGVSRRLVAACRLDWEPACLEFHRTRRQVRTASMIQVRQPIYKKSVGRWKNYETALADLFAALPQEEGMRDEG